MNIFPFINDKLETAINNAKKVEKYQLENRKKLYSEKCIPYTAIYKVVEELLERNIKM